MIAVTLICIVLIILTSESRGKITPMEKSITYVVIPLQKGVTYFGDWLNSKVDFLKNINQLEAMNQSLTEEVDQLRYDNKILQQDKTELTHLRQLFELDQQYADYPKIGARVIGKDPGSWYEVFIIDKGEQDGLKVNMVVMSGNGLVGRIIEVGPGFSKVKSIIDDTNSVSAKILRTSDLCTVRGDKTLGDKGLNLVEYIDESANIIEGDEIVTSHLGQIYPPGIMIGTIKSITANPHKLTKTAVLEPVVDFKHLEEVLVINQLWTDLDKTSGTSTKDSTIINSEPTTDVEYTVTSSGISTSAGSVSTTGAGILDPDYVIPEGGDE